MPRADREPPQGLQRRTRRDGIVPASHALELAPDLLDVAGRCVQERLRGPAEQGAAVVERELPLELSLRRLWRR